MSRLVLIANRTHFWSRPAERGRFGDATKRSMETVLSPGVIAHHQEEWPLELPNVTAVARHNKLYYHIMFRYDRIYTMFYLFIIGSVIHITAHFDDPSTPLMGDVVDCVISNEKLYKSIMFDRTRIYRVRSESYFLKFPRTIKSSIQTTHYSQKGASVHQLRELRSIMANGKP